MKELANKELLGGTIELAIKEVLRLFMTTELAK